MSTQQRWLTRVIEDRGWRCGNCGQWRILKADYCCVYASDEQKAAAKRLIEECPNCGDEAFDIYEAAADEPL